MSTTQSICIPLTLYSKHIPSKTVTIEKDYLLFGHYDALEIGENLFEGGKCDFTKLWEHSVEHADLSSIQRNFSKQTLYALRTNVDEEDHSNEDDETFWKSDDLPPFLFLCIIQTGDIDDLYKRRKSLKQDVIDKYTQINPALLDDIHVKLYSSLENNCIILAFRCADFQKGLDIISTYHDREEGEKNELRIQYTYTTVGFRSDYDYRKLYNQKIKAVHLYVIERTPGSAGELYKELEERIKVLNELGEQIVVEQQQIVGNDDELWVIKNISWEAFLGFYLTDNPLLAGGTEKCEEHTYSIATHFMNDRRKRIKSEKSSNNDDNDEKTDDVDKKREKTHCEKIHKVLVELKAIYDCGTNQALHNKRKGYYKSLTYIINSLEKFEYAYTLTDHFNDYTYFMLYEPLLFMAEAILIATKMEDMGISLRGRFAPRQIYSFLNSVNMITHHTMHSDRQFMQTPDFNAIIFETPAKLGAFYGALVNLEKKILCSNNQMDYQFLIVPGLHEFVRVEELFIGFLNNKRLSTIEIPEQQMFEPEFIIPVLMHEIAHKTGSEIRLRTQRYQSFLDVISYMLSVDLVKFCVGSVELDINKMDVQFLHNVIFPELNFFAKEENDRRNLKRKDEIDKIKRSEQFNGIVEQIESDYDLLHTENMKNNILSAVEKFLSKIQENRTVMNQLWETYNTSQKKDYDEFIRALDRYLLFYINNREVGDCEDGWKYNLFRSELKDMIYVYREVYADVISIEMLEIDINKYLNVVTKNDFQIIDTSIYESVNMIRIALVVLVMQRMSRWNPEDLLVGNDLTSTKSDEIKNRILDIILYIYGGKKLKTPLDAPLVFKYKKVWDLIADYMIGCVKKLEETMNENVLFVGSERTKEELRNDIRNVYRIIEKQEQEGVDTLLKEIENKIEEFKRDIYKR